MHANLYFPREFLFTLCSPKGSIIAPHQHFQVINNCHAERGLFFNYYKIQVITI